MKLITIIAGRMTLITQGRSPVQRSKSASDGHKNFVNVIAPQRLNGFQSKLTQIFPTV